MNSQNLKKGDRVMDKVSMDCGKIISAHPESTEFVLVRLNKYITKQYRRNNLVKNDGPFGGFSVEVA